MDASFGLVRGLVWLLHTTRLEVSYPIFGIGDLGHIFSSLFFFFFGGGGVERSLFTKGSGS